MTSDTISIRSLQTTVLDTPPSCVEYLPSDQAFLVIGTYHLHAGADRTEDSCANAGQAINHLQSRSGSLVLLKSRGNNMYAYDPASSIMISKDRSDRA